MSVRARKSRLLASKLTAKSGTYVRVYYDRKIRRYRVVWTSGPNVEEMFTLASGVAPEVPEMNIGELLWDRQTPIKPN